MANGSRRGRGTGALAAALAAMAVLCAGATAAPQARRAPARPTAPLISTTSRSPLFQAAEVRLARFIRALQRGDRRRAAALLSSRVSAAERRALLENRWLRRNGRDRFEQVLFLPDLQIRTRAVYPDRVELIVVPRRAATPRRERLTGYLEVPMRRERGNWWVELHPDPAIVKGR